MQPVSPDFSPAPARKAVHPSLFTLLILPLGVAGGYVQVTLAYLLSEAGVSVEKIAAVVAASVLPHVLKFLWAPLVDTTLTFKKWYWLSGVTSSLVLVAMSLLPLTDANLPLLTLGIYAYHFFISFAGMAAAGLMAYEVPAALHGRAAGYYQIGNLGGGGIGGGLGLLLAQRLPMAGLAGVVLGVLCLGCCLALLAFRDQTTTIRAARISDTYRAMGQDVWATLRTKSGWLGLVICLLPLGTGAASGLWSAVAKDWGAGADTVALVTGILGGLVSAVGCLLGGWVCDRVSPRYAYLLFGLAAAACLVGMAYAPRTEPMFIVGTLLYALANGTCYASFTAITLEAIGKGAAVTKYNLFASLSNSPAYLLMYVLGFAYARFGARGMLNTEALFAVGAVVFFLVLQQTVLRNKIPRWRKQAAAPAEAALVPVPVKIRDETARVG